MSADLIPGLSGYSIRPPKEPEPDPVPCVTCGHTKERPIWSRPHDGWVLVDATGKEVWSNRYPSLAEAERAMHDRIAADYVTAMVDEISDKFLVMVETYLQGRITEPLTDGDKRKIQEGAWRAVGEILNMQQHRRRDRLRKYQQEKQRASFQAQTIA